MRILLTEAFQRDVVDLSSEEQSQLWHAVLKLPQAIKNLHSQTGLGLRKIHPSGIFEARIGLQLRVVFGYEGPTLVLDHVGNHESVRRYLKSL